MYSSMKCKYTCCKLIIILISFPINNQHWSEWESAFLWIWLPQNKKKFTFGSNADVNSNRIHETDSPQTWRKSFQFWQKEFWTDCLKYYNFKKKIQIPSLALMVFHIGVTNYQIYISTLFCVEMFTVIKQEVNVTTLFHFSVTEQQNSAGSVKGSSSRTWTSSWTRTTSTVCCWAGSVRTHSATMWWTRSSSGFWRPHWYKDCMFFTLRVENRTDILPLR